MYTEDDIQYAIENTEVLREPENRIETFGTTVFHFHHITELMDNVNQIRVRDGRVHAERPQIIKPTAYEELTLEGFGEKANQFADWLRENARHLAILKYGFSFRKTDVTESIVHDSVDAVMRRVLEDADSKADPHSAVLKGIDDAWEVCLLQFAAGMVQRSAGDNASDFKRRGLL